MGFKHESRARIDLYNSTGKLVAILADETIKTNDFFMVFDKHSYGLTKGVYLIHAWINGKSFYRKLSIIE